MGRKVGNPLADPKGLGSVGGDPPPTIGLVGSSGGGSGSGGSVELGGWTGFVDTPIGKAKIYCGLKRGDQEVDSS